MVALVLVEQNVEILVHCYLHEREALTRLHLIINCNIFCTKKEPRTGARGSLLAGEGGVAARVLAGQLGDAIAKVVVERPIRLVAGLRLPDVADAARPKAAASVHGWKIPARAAAGQNGSAIVFDAPLQLRALRDGLFPLHWLLHAVRGSVSARRICASHAVAPSFFSKDRLLHGLHPQSNRGSFCKSLSAVQLILCIRCAPTIR